MAGKTKEKKGGSEVKKAQLSKSAQPSPYSPAQIKKFVGEVQSEFTKIVWPDKKVTLGLTGMVILLAIIVSVYLGTVDVILGKIISSILH
jgi:preprotein translocase subunit SecE